MRTLHRRSGQEEAKVFRAKRQDDALLLRSSGRGTQNEVKLKTKLLITFYLVTTVDAA